MLQGLAGTQVPLAVLPAGTANVLANEIGVQVGMAAAAAEVATLTPRRVALGRLGNQVERWFLLMAGVGLDAHIVYHLDLRLKAHWGKGAYWAAGAQVVGRQLAEFAVEADGCEFSSSFTLVSRVRNYAGDFQIAPSATLFDDSFELVLFQGRRSTGYLKFLLGMMAGRLAAMRGVTIRRARQIRLSLAADPRVYVQVDGEYAGRLPATIEFVPDALTLLLPAAYPGNGR